MLPRVSDFRHSVNSSFLSSCFRLLRHLRMQIQFVSRNNKASVRMQSSRPCAEMIGTATSAFSLFSDMKFSGECFVAGSKGGPVRRYFISDISRLHFDQQHHSPLSGDVFLNHFGLVLAECSVIGIRCFLHSCCGPPVTVIDMRGICRRALEARACSECQWFCDKLLQTCLLEFSEASFWG